MSQLMTTHTLYLAPNVTNLFYRDRPAQVGGVIRKMKVTVCVDLLQGAFFTLDRIVIV